MQSCANLLGCDEFWMYRKVDYVLCQVSSGITHGRVLKGELYIHRVQKLNYLYSLKELFHEDFSSIVRTNPDT